MSEQYRDWEQESLGFIGSDEYESIARRIQKFVESGEGRYVQNLIERIYDMEIVKLREMAKGACSPHVQAEIAATEGRLEVLEWLSNGCLGFKQPLG